MFSSEKEQIFLCCSFLFLFVLDFPLAVQSGLSVLIDTSSGTFPRQMMTLAPVLLIFPYESFLSLLNKITILPVTQVLAISALCALSCKKYPNTATLPIRVLEASFALRIAVSFLSYYIDQCWLLFFYTSDSSAFLHFTITTALAKIRFVNLFFSFSILDLPIVLSPSCPSLSKRFLTGLLLFFPPVHVSFAIVPSSIMLQKCLWLLSVSSLFLNY